MTTDSIAVARAAPASTYRQAERVLWRHYELQPAEPGWGLSSPLYYAGQEYAAVVAGSWRLVPLVASCAPIGG